MTLSEPMTLREALARRKDIRLPSLATWRKEPLRLPTPAANDALHHPSFGFDPRRLYDLGKWSRSFPDDLLSISLSIDGAPEIHDLPLAVSYTHGTPVRMTLDLPRRLLDSLPERKRIEMRMRARHPHPECPDSENVTVCIKENSWGKLVVLHEGRWEACPASEDEA